MGFLDKVKSQAEQVAAKTKEGIEDVQTKRELSQLFTDLGKEAFALHEQGELQHPTVADFAGRIRDVKAKLEEPAEGAAEAAEPEAEEASTT